MKNPKTIEVTDSTGKIVKTTFPVAYIVLDSVMSNYEYYNKINEEFKVLYQREDNALKQKGMQLQKEYEEMMTQYQKGFMTSQNAEAKQIELEKRQQELMQLQQRKSQELALKEENLSKELQDSLRAAVDVYNADGRFEIVLNNAYNSSIIHANDQLNITNGVLQLMNKRYTAAKATK